MIFIILGLIARLSEYFLHTRARIPTYTRMQHRYVKKPALVYGLFILKIVTNAFANAHRLTDNHRYLTRNNDQRTKFQNEDASFGDSSSRRPFEPLFGRHARYPRLLHLNGHHGPERCGHSVVTSSISIERARSFAAVPVAAVSRFLFHRLHACARSAIF